MTEVSFRRFFVSLAATVLMIFVGVWPWALLGRMSFLDPEYAMWTAKVRMIQDCARNKTVILGDSQPMAGLIPEVMGPDVTNLSLGGGSPIEAFYLLGDLLRCPTPPERVVIAFSPTHFVRTDEYWTRTALFSFLTLQQMEDVRLTSRRLGDGTVYSTSLLGSALDRIQNHSYHVSLPSYYFPAMINAGFFTRKGRNLEVLEATLRGRGHHFFGTATRADLPAPEVDGPGFKPVPIMLHYFERTMALLQEKAISAYFVSMPYTEATYRAKPKLRAVFSDFMGELSGRYSNLRIVGDVLPTLPADHFGDPDHLNEKGALIWSRLVADKIAAMEARKPE